MKSLKQMLPGALLVVSAYMLYSQPLGTVLLTFGMGMLLWVLTNSLWVVLGIFLVGALMPSSQGNFKPVVAPAYSVPAPVESFQVKDPASVHSRIEDVKQGAPLQPKVAHVTGVLESPSILDNVPLKPMQELTEDAAPGASIPASAKARVAIYTPNEGFVPAPTESRERPPKENPYLQNGPDMEGVAASLTEKGTDMPTADSPAMVASTEVGAGPA